MMRPASSSMVPMYVSVASHVIRKGYFEERHAFVPCVTNPEDGLPEKSPLTFQLWPIAIRVT
jgi:hypothetical protein